MPIGWKSDGVGDISDRRELNIINDQILIESALSLLLLSGKALLLRLIKIVSLKEVLNDLIIIRDVLCRLDWILECLSNFIILVRAIDQVLL